VKVRALGWLCMAVALAGLLRDSSVHLWKERSLEGVPTTRIDPRYAQLAAALPREEIFGYLSDGPLGEEKLGRRYFDALYALAPRVLVPDDPEARFFIADATDAQALARLERERGLSEVMVFGATALLERAR
jgi:hypothetical protein